MPPLTVWCRIGAPPRPSLPCISRGFSVLSNVTGSSEKKFPLRQRVSRSACVSAGTASNRDPLVVSAIAPFLSWTCSSSKCTFPFVVCACTEPPPSYTSIFPFTVRSSSTRSIPDTRTVNGNIEVYEGGGSVHAHTTNGNVHLELLHVQDKNGAIAETTNGSLLLAVP